ncbi:hypothetical protein M885DRAFT_521024 [Pelagophyceae sp. CCMP2097]|nr:hypothetical protein M885DRAFT_521024 [Pelagophyceae sp. CCMP2097]
MRPCMACGTATAKLCARCKDAAFCSAACQREVWGSHKVTCGKSVAPAAVSPAASAEPFVPASMRHGEGSFEPGSFQRLAEKCHICAEFLEADLRTHSMCSACGETSCMDCMERARALTPGLACPFCRALPARTRAEYERQLSARADAGNARAQFNYGVALANGDDVVKNPKKGAHYFALAADQGDEEARASLGRCYHEGRGVRCEPKKALKLFTQAADNGNATAQAALGTFFATGGLGLKVDDAKSLYYTRRAAAQGSSLAIFNLAVSYKDGSGVAQDQTEAMRLFREADKLGYPPAGAFLAKVAAMMAAAGITH